MNTDSRPTKERAHHLKTDAAWLADVEQTAKSVKRQNECGKTSPVELAASEVLELVRLARLALEPAADVVAAMLDYNQMLRSFAMIASRNGEQTRWEGLYDQIHALLAKHHETWKRYFPPMQGDEQPETKAAKRDNGICLTCGTAHDDFGPCPAQSRSGSPE